MGLSNEAIEEFRALYLQEFGVELTTEEAMKLGTKLVRLVKIVLGDKLPTYEFKESQEKKGGNYD